MIKKISLRLIIFLAFFWFKAGLAQAVNDSFDKAIPITDPTKCSSEGTYSNIGATDEKKFEKPAYWSTTESGNDVWFKFTAIAKDLNITVTGDNTGGGTTGGTLKKPHIALYTIDATGTSFAYSTIIGGYLPGSSVSTFKKGGLVIGKEYYIRVSAADKNVGTFKLCINNYFAPTTAGQDFETASFLCDKGSFTEHNVLGSGLDNMESFGSCLGWESNTAWYKWVAANDGTLTMDITPIFNSDDIDWVLYDLGPSGDFDNKILLRCATGHGVSNIGCPTEPLYYKTGMNLTSTDTVETSGCGLGGQDGYLKYVDLKAGHTYALLVDNYSNGNNGFKIEFGGTSEFEGPVAKINLITTELCLNNPNFIFTSTGSEKYEKLEWYFGEGASISSSTDPNPPPITYSSPGYKTVLLRAFNDKDCSSNITQSFYVHPKPETPVINGLKSSYCIGENIILSTPSQTDATYSWTGPNGFTSNLNEINILIDDPNKVGTYSLSISKNGCVSDIKSVTIPPIDALPIADFSNTINNLCESTQSYTFTNNSTGYSKLLWNFGPDASIATSTDPNPPAVSYSSPGIKTVSLQVFNNNDCFVSISKSLTVNTKPELPIINGLKSGYCIGDNIVLSTPLQTDVTYSWTGPNGFTSTLNEISVLIDNPDKVGVYNLKISKNGCTSDIKSVTVPPIEVLPIADFSHSISNQCESTQSYTFTNNSTAFTKVLWNFGADASIATSTDSNPPAVSYSSPGVKTVNLQVFNKNDCFVSISKSFTVTIKPNPPIINGLKSDYCIGDKIILSTALQTDVTYSWTGPNGFTSTLNEINILIDNPNKAGVYNLKIIKNGCTSDVSSVTVAPIGQNPKASFIISSNNLCSPTQSFTFTNSSSNFTSLRWDFGDGASIAPGSNSLSNTVTYSTPGPKTIKLEAIGSSGCSNIFSQDINVTISPKIPVITIIKPELCEIAFIKLSTPHQDDVIYQWTGPNGFTSNLREPEIPVNDPLVAGTYSLSISRGTCVSPTVNVTVEAIYTKPIAEFRTDPQIPFKIIPPFKVKFFNECKDADSFLWDFGDGNTSTEMNPTHTYLSDGDFIITLTAFKNSLCSTTISKSINKSIGLGLAFFAPNTFTPNGDGINDVFVVNMFTVISYKIQIFNRYGVPLFISNDLNNHWDGTFNGEQLPVGTYYYIINAIDLNGESIQKSGSITIVR